MKADKRFQNQTKEFWANVRIISQEVGYTDRKTKSILIPSAEQIRKAFAHVDLNAAHLFDDLNKPTPLGKTLLDYFAYRADVLNNKVQHDLMNKTKAKALFKELRKKLKPKCPLPMNKQKGDKKTYNFLTCIVNMLIEASINGQPCDYDPRSLTTLTVNSRPLRTLARRVDGAFPSVVNPVSIWEIKEYYSTTTFGSRVADGVYETLLDGLELEELEGSEDRTVLHYLIVDDYFTWWKCGRSYLCRIVDMLHMGYIDEVFFGKEVLEALPPVAKSWVKLVT